MKKENHLSATACVDGASLSERERTHPDIRETVSVSIVILRTLMHS